MNIRLTIFEPELSSTVRLYNNWRNGKLLLPPKGPCSLYITRGSRKHRITWLCFCALSECVTVMVFHQNVTTHLRLTADCSTEVLLFLIASRIRWRRPAEFQELALDCYDYGPSPSPTNVSDRTANYLTDPSPIKCKLLSFGPGLNLLVASTFASRTSTKWSYYLKKSRQEVCQNSLTPKLFYIIYASILRPKEKTRSFLVKLASSIRVFLKCKKITNARLYFSVL